MIKKKTTSTMLRTVLKEGLCLLSFFFFSRWCIHVFFFLYDNLVFIYWCIFFSDSEINECVRGLHKCSSDAFCNNTKGSYNCTCKHGFTGNGRECRGRHWIQQQLCDEKMKLTSLNYQQRNRNLHLDSLSRKIHSETERKQRYMQTKSH